MGSIGAPRVVEVNTLRDIPVCASIGRIILRSYYDYELKDHNNYC